MRSNTVIVSAVMAAMLAACAVEQESEDTGLHVTTYTDIALAGSFTELDTEVSFDARTDDSYVLITLGVDDALFEIAYHRGSGEIEVDGQGAVLTPAQKLALAHTGEALAHWIALPGEEMAAHEQLLISHAVYFSEAPTGYSHAFRAELTTPELSVFGFGDDGRQQSGIECIGNGAKCVVKYRKTQDDSTGTTVKYAVKINSDWGTNRAGSGGDYGCMGRCGAGCSGFSLYGRRTLDCLEHDTCSWAQNATGGSSHKHCGDEYDEAYNDFVDMGWPGCDGASKWACACNSSGNDCDMNSTSASNKTCLSSTCY